MLVAEMDGVIVGGALALQTGDAVKIDAIAVKPEARERGIGRKLIGASCPMVIGFSVAYEVSKLGNYSGRAAR